MKFPPHLDFRYLKRTLTIAQVLADQGWISRFRTRGSYLIGPCPIHQGDNPNAFRVHQERNIWRCFTGCDDGGDLVKLACRICGSFRAAAIYLASLAPAPQPDLIPLRAQQRDQLPFRPFTKRLRLDPHSPFLRRKRIREQIAKRFQVGQFHGKGMLEGCLAVRLFDPHAKPIGYAGRRLDQEQADLHGKWKFPPRLPKETLLYGYHQAEALSGSGAVLVECPWGVLRLQQLHIPAIALLGTHMSAHQKDLLSQLPSIVILMDGDKAGSKAAYSIRHRISQARIVELPDGFDPDDLEDQQLIKVGHHLASRPGSTSHSSNLF